MTEKFPNLYIELSQKVDQSIRIIQTQLQSIDSSLLNAFISLIITSFLSKQYGLLVYWIPSSFLLMWIILSSSWLLSAKRGRAIEKDTKKKRSSISSKGLFILLSKFKNTAPFFKTIAVIFFVTFTSLVMKEKLVATDIDIPIILPIISCALFFSLSILNNIVIGQIERKRSNLEFLYINVKGWAFISGYTLILLIALFVLPICSLVLLNKIYTSSFSVILPIILVIILQIITTITFMNYFSAMSVKKEMTITMAKYSKIQQRIDYATLNNAMSNANYSSIKESYEEAKLFDITSDDSLLVNFYSLIPNQNYLSRLTDKPLIYLPKKKTRKQIYRQFIRMIRRYRQKKKKAIKALSPYPYFPQK